MEARRAVHLRRERPAASEVRAREADEQVQIVCGSCVLFALGTREQFGETPNPANPVGMGDQPKVADASRKRGAPSTSDGSGRKCEHGREKRRCKECGGSGICTHGKDKRQCKECGGSAICPHGRQKRLCIDCGGSGICTHGKRKSTCKECGSATGI